jgi:hypothetical protein
MFAPLRIVRGGAASGPACVQPLEDTMERSLTLVLVTHGPARQAAPILAERFPHVRCETGSLLVAIGKRDTPESVLAYCRERQIDVVASCVVSRTVHPTTPTLQEVPS